MARYIQRVLLMIGFTFLGILSGGLGLAFLSIVTIFRTAPGTSAESNQGIYFGVLFVMLSGAVCGAIVGLTTAICRTTRHEFRHWHLLTWLGILSGICSAGTLLLTDTLSSYGILADLFRTWPGTILLVISLATLGGIAGGFASRLLPGKLRSLPLLVFVLKMTSDRY